MSTSWHRFAPVSDDDHDCRQPDCGLIVSDDVLEHELVAVECPAPACGESSNDGPCVLVLAADADGVLYPVCAYCDVRGDLAEAEDPSEG